MKGTLIKNKNSEWLVQYTDSVYLGAINGQVTQESIGKEPKQLPLHPEDIKKYNEYLFNGGEVEFEPIDEIIDLGWHGSTIIRYAKITKMAKLPKRREYKQGFKHIEEEFEKERKMTELILNSNYFTKTGAFDKEGDAITRGYVEPTESWDEIWKKYSEVVKIKGVLTTPFKGWLEEHYLAPIKKQ